MYNEDIHELYHVVWRPQTTQQHPLGDSVAPATAPHASALEFLGNVKTPSKPAGAYRPPGARGTATPLAFKREDEGGAAFVREMMSGKDSGSNGGPFRAGPRRREVPGAETVEPKVVPGAAAGGGVSLVADADENLSKAALKNKKKREAKKLKEAEAKTAGLSTPVENGSSNASRKDRPRSRSKSAQDAPRAPSRKREASRPRGTTLTTPQTPVKGGAVNGSKSAAAAAPPVPVVPTAAPELSVTSPGTGSIEEKKIRSLLKKLRAIDDLKMRQAGGEKLEGTQVLKIGTEEGVRKELTVLGYNGD
nr:eukaryotic translation initiation factor 2a [Quercus suber]